MNQMHRRWFLGLVVVMLVSLFFSMNVNAGVVIEDYNPKLNGVQGKITKMEGNKLTIMSEKGNLITIGIAGKSADDKHKLRSFKIGDRVKIQDGKLFQLSELQKPPLQPAGGAAVVTYTNQPLQPAGGTAIFTMTRGQGSPAQGK